MGFRAELLQDWQANGESTKSQVIMVGYRLANAAVRGHVPGPFAKIVILGYKVTTTWVLGVEIPPETEIGPELRLIHPQAIVVNGQTTIGARCVLRASTTIGNVMDRDGEPSASPFIGDDVELGAGVTMIGPIKIGDRARIGAGSVVIKDVPADETAVGNPARSLGVRTLGE